MTTKRVLPEQRKAKEALQRALDDLVQAEIKRSMHDVLEENRKLKNTLRVAREHTARLEKTIATWRANTEAPLGDGFSLKDLQRVLRGYDSARAAGTLGGAPLHELIARALLRRIEREVLDAGS